MRHASIAGTAAGKNADVMADQLMNQHGVRERVNELKEANSRKATLSREQTIEFLCNVINTSAAKVDADSPLVQSAEFENGQPAKLRIPDKIAAVKELTKMCGWAQPNRIELSATDTLAEFIDSIRESGQDWRTWGRLTRKLTGSEARVGGHAAFAPEFAVEWRHRPL